MFLQLWSWEHFPIGRSTIVMPVHSFGEFPDLIDGPTMGIRWTAADLRRAKGKPSRCYLLWHNELELLHNNDAGVPGR